MAVYGQELGLVSDHAESRKLERATLTYGWKSALMRRSVRDVLGWPTGDSDMQLVVLLAAVLFLMPGQATTIGVSQPTVFLIPDDEVDPVPVARPCKDLTNSHVRNEYSTKGSAFYHIWYQDCGFNGTCRGAGAICKPNYDPAKLLPCKCS